MGTGGGGGEGGAEEVGKGSQREGRRSDGVPHRSRRPCGWERVAAGVGAWEGHLRGWPPWSGRPCSRSPGVLSLWER